MRKLAWLMILVFILSGSVLGCGTGTKKPLTTPKNNLQKGTSSTPKSTTTAQPNMERVLADRVATIAKQVGGVKSATVVVSRSTGTSMTTGTGYTAMVGIELSSNTKGSTAEMVKKQVGSRVKSKEKQITKVLVTTDPNMITRLKDIAAGVIKGRPISGFAKEIDELARRITPTMK